MEVVRSMEDTKTLLEDVVKHSGTCVVEGYGDLWIRVAKADGRKCERCWNYSRQVGSFEQHLTLCGRCHSVISSQHETVVATSAKDRHL